MAGIAPKSSHWLAATVSAASAVSKAVPSTTQKPAARMQTVPPLGDAIARFQQLNGPLTCHLGCASHVKAQQAPLVGAVQAGPPMGPVRPLITLVKPPAQVSPATSKAPAVVRPPPAVTLSAGPTRLPSVSAVVPAAINENDSWIDAEDLAALGDGDSEELPMLDEDDEAAIRAAEEQALARVLLDPVPAGPEVGMDAEPLDPALAQISVQDLKERDAQLVEQELALSVSIIDGDGKNLSQFLAQRADVRAERSRIAAVLSSRGCPPSAASGLLPPRFPSAGQSSVHTLQPLATPATATFSTSQAWHPLPPLPASGSTSPALPSHTPASGPQGAAVFRKPSQTSQAESIECTPASNPLQRARARGATGEERAEAAPLSDVGRWTGPEAWNVPNFSWSPAVLTILKRVWGYAQFRTNQEAVINATLSKRDVFVMMPTGGGKSLCFQLPAVFEGGVTLVISPLLSLIQDQVDQWNGSVSEENGRAVFLSASTDSSEVLQKLRMRNQDLRLLYVTPEKIAASGALRAALQRCAANLELKRIVIDEWGHDFRPDYKTLNVLKRELPDVPLLALTATATEQVKKDVIRQLELRDPTEFTQSFNRPNLRYAVVRKKKGSAAEEIAGWIRQMYPHGVPSGIIYCTSRRECQEVAIRLHDDFDIKAKPYHAELPPEVRAQTQREWTSDEVKVVVATIAFGMGINKPDVRFVIHYSLPKSIEGYYQEAGRAGRDGLEAHCILYYTYADKSRIEFMIKDSRERRPDPANVRRQMDHLFAVVSYCENIVDCRRVLQLAYLGETFDRAHCHRTCDNCKSVVRAIRRDVTEQARQLLSMVRAAPQQLSPTQAELLFRGSAVQGKPHLARLPGVGAGSKMTKTDSERLVRHLVLLRVLQEDIEVNQYGGMNSRLLVDKLFLLSLTLVQEGERGADLLAGRMVVEMDFHPSGKTMSALSRDAKLAEAAEEQAGDAASQTPLTPAQSALFDALGETRRRLAQEHNVKAYVVWSNATQRALAVRCPRTTADLEGVENLGRHRAQRYGAAILAAVAQHMGAPASAHPPPPAPPSRPPPVAGRPLPPGNAGPAKAAAAPGPAGDKRPSPYFPQQTTAAKRPRPHPPPPPPAPPSLGKGMGIRTLMPRPPPPL